MDDLTKLAIKYKADKWGKHHYTPYYHKLFKHHRNIKKVLEIGAGEGASLFMWRDYFPKAMIYSAEIDLKRVFRDYRILVCPCDQSKKEHLIDLVSAIGVDIDLVVDDGSHKPEDQVFTCKELLPTLKKDCTYIIEDVSDATIIEKLDMFNCKLVRVGDRYDDQLLVVKK
jgi:hypothetical protein